MSCPDCDQPMLPPGRRKLPNEYDHANGCSRADAKIKAVAWNAPHPAVRVTMIGAQTGAVRTVTDGRTEDAYLTITPREAARLHAQLGEAVDALQATRSGSDPR
jgi:hypothetical protein